MHAHRPLLALLAATLVACAGDRTNGPAATPTPPAAGVGTFDLVSANGLALPASASRRTLPNGRIEEVVLERGTLILNADGTWTQELVGHVYEDRQPMGTYALADGGRWTLAASGGVMLTSGYPGRVTNPRADSGTRVSLMEHVRLGTPTIVATRYAKRVVPADPIGTWTLSHAIGTAVPSVINRFRTPLPTGEYVSDTQVDSARLTLSADGRYVQLFWLSEWNDGTFNVRYQWGDHGTWTRTGSTIAFTSDWIAPIRFSANVNPDGTMGTVQLPDLGAAGAAPLAWARR